MQVKPAPPCYPKQDGRVAPDRRGRDNGDQARCAHARACPGAGTECRRCRRGGRRVACHTLSGRSVPSLARMRLRGRTGRRRWMRSRRCAGTIRCGARPSFVLLRREGWVVSESTTGRILAMLVARGRVVPVPALRRRPPWRPPQAAPRQTPAQGPEASRPARSSSSTRSASSRRRPAHTQAAPRARQVDLRPGLPTRQRHNAKDFLDKHRHLPHPGHTGR